MEVFHVRPGCIVQYPLPRNTLAEFKESDTKAVTGSPALEYSPLEQLLSKPMDRCLGHASPARDLRYTQLLICGSKALEDKLDLADD